MSVPERSNVLFGPKPVGKLSLNCCNSICNIFIYITRGWSIPLRGRETKRTFPTMFWRHTRCIRYSSVGYSSLSFKTRQHSQIYGESLIASISMDAESLDMISALYTNDNRFRVANYGEVTVKSSRRSEIREVARVKWTYTLVNQKSPRKALRSSKFLSLTSSRMLLHLVASTSISCLSVLFGGLLSPRSKDRAIATDIKFASCGRGRW